MPRISSLHYRVHFFGLVVIMDYPLAVARAQCNFSSQTQVASGWPEALPPDDPDDLPPGCLSSCLRKCRDSQKTLAMNLMMFAIKRASLQLS
ncbi:hypothetical protein Droror1_Dr00014230 [Drosera rotundifolia]